MNLYYFAAAACAVATIGFGLARMGGQAFCFIGLTLAFLALASNVPSH